MTDHFMHGYALLVGVGESAYSPWSLPVTSGMRRRCGRSWPTRSCAPTRTTKDTSGCCTTPAPRARRSWAAWPGWRRRPGSIRRRRPCLLLRPRLAGPGERRLLLVAHDVASFDVAASALPAQAFGAAIRRMRPAAAGDHGLLPRRGMATAKEEPAAGCRPAWRRRHAPGAGRGAQAGRGPAVFTSCRGRQRSWVRPDGAASIYTYHLLEALQGGGQPAGRRAGARVEPDGPLGQAVPRAPGGCAGGADAVFRHGDRGFPGGGAARRQRAAGRRLADGEARAERAIDQVYQATVKGSGAVAQGPGAQARRAGRDRAGYCGRW